MITSSDLQFKSINYTGLAPGPRLIVTGAVHGNETCGTRGITRVMQQLDSGALRIKAGSVTFVPVTNPLAYAKGERSGDRNLNRNLFPNDHPQDFEDHIANWLCPLLGQHDVLLDLHSFNADSQPFVMVGPRNNDGPLQPFQHEQKERALARRLGVKRFVDGWLHTYGQGVQRRLSNDKEMALVLRYGVGTTEYMRSTGGYALTLECGQHNDPAAPEVAYTAIINTLAFLGLIDAPAPPAIADADLEFLNMVVVHDKASAGDTFVRTWSSFDRVRQGDQIGTRADGTPVTAEFDALILFPDSKAAAGNEWYYLARVNPVF
ncbi:succinylglutamate desuccinylase/aspartoacylase domain-containing protein [Janthinobacterium agaricidamnosum]|uniref:Succinylglutamate desuccinylase / Aspartoacylase family protein n=1 Tax=Janthinobacterium agaricidamnosum NBRC 102515 = DSM 9628 TaxID=1349767 RepID=W0V7D8_9BURK|nr:succinylglutamate desuccinylase/aspartoacylase family protein [Janthinobacterium agaricidamnosum]CDG83490.1 succinylglutamate desuccinylase / Aspartoacylase family protein [Janthinobacterium agaricidamnosum NBRC 102515 = DSM 9628]